MKKLLLLVLTITTSTFFTGCSEDETEPLKQTDPIIGQWKFSSKWIRKGDNSTLNTEKFVLQTPSTKPKLADCGSILFDTAGTFSYSSSGLTETCAAFTGNFTREFSNKYILTGTNETRKVYTNFAYNNQQLIIFEEIVGNGDGVSGTPDELYTLKTVYERIQN